MSDSLRATCSETPRLLQGDVKPPYRDFPCAVYDSSFQHGDDGDGDDQVATGQDGAVGGETLLSSVRRSRQKGSTYSKTFLRLSKTFQRKVADILRLF